MEKRITAKRVGDHRFTFPRSNAVIDTTGKLGKHGDPLREHVTPEPGDEFIRRALESAHKSALVHDDQHLLRATDEAARQFLDVKRGVFAPVLKRARPRFDGFVRPVKISVSYVDAASHRAIASAIQIVLDSYTADAAPTDAGLSFGYGVGAGWGMEQCVHINTCSAVDPTRFIVSLLHTFSQEFAYVEVDGLGWEVGVDREWIPITG